MTSLREEQIKTIYNELIKSIEEYIQNNHFAIENIKLRRCY